ncbi:hypothetical protein [Fuerstiella marisgermanici]|uniref:Uncharacterized protein n=1 Tax=Fuerstiella marisgermanici TaxID=1891926 RepID=A0A1P8WMR5_9PLAN|nr:hypothetical protein [Fuerstiella marisgermanici]APZ95327.1 hypothetical protein Fuma_04983 [Fuerstiella marisgermanici]
MIAVFLLKLSAGITMMWWLMPRKEVTDGFFRIQMRVLLGLTVLTALSLATGTTWPVAAAGGEMSEAVVTSSEAKAISIAWWIRALSIFAAAVCYAGTVFWALGRRLPGNLCIHLLTASCVSALALHSWNVPNTGSVGLQLLSDFSSAAVVGGVLTGMLLGHWYLTTPTMSTLPIWWFNKAILTAAVLRLVASIWAFAEFGGSFSDSTQQIWFGIRWLGGIVAPVIVAILVWRVLKHRNTQSATGILFAGLILAFMGEMTAALLERDTMIPF